MASTGTLTVTGKIGPGNTLTSYVIKNITVLSFDIPNARLTYGQGGEFNDIDITAATTATVVLSAAAGNYTVTIS